MVIALAVLSALSTAAAIWFYLRGRQEQGVPRDEVHELLLGAHDLRHGLEDSAQWILTRLRSMLDCVAVGITDGEGLLLGWDGGADDHYPDLVLATTVACEHGRHQIVAHETLRCRRRSSCPMRTADRRTGELAYYRCYAPQRVPLATLVRVAGRRWTVEESFQTSKGQTGLDEHQCRTWTSWYRWTTLVLLAHTFLATVTVTARSQPAPAGLIPLTLNEIRHLYNSLALASAADFPHILHWSRWRRRHQHRAQQAHYQQQSRQEQ